MTARPLPLRPLVLPCGIHVWSMRPNDHRVCDKPRGHEGPHDGPQTPCKLAHGEGLPVTTYRPLPHRVILRPIASPSRTPAGLHIPEAAQDRTQEAIVVATGPFSRYANGEKHAPPIQAGQRVIYYGSGEAIFVDGQECVVLPEHNVLAVVEA